MKVRQLIDNGDGTHTVPLTRGKAAVIDASDVETVGAFNWIAHRSGGHWYGRRRDGQRLVLLHRSILAVPAEMVVDHVNGDTLDNRRLNLRPATRAQNARNARTPSHSRSGIKGACLFAGRWRARIRLNGKQVCLGRFDTAEEAHAAYSAAAKQHFGEFARVS